MSLTPSEVRKRILTEHGALRSKLEDLERVAERLSTDPSAGGELAALVAAFVEGFLQHIGDEERILRPLLADIDAWGHQRVEKMDEEHSVQRARVDKLRGFVAQPPSAWVGELCALIAELRDEMAGEEKDCLSPNLLRDDTVTIDYFGG